MLVRVIRGLKLVRSQDVPSRQWLEGHIDPPVKLISNASDEELNNISFARTLVEE